MLARLVYNFLTLVVIALTCFGLPVGVMAAPHFDAPSAAARESAEIQGAESDPTVIENMSVTNAPPEKNLSEKVGSRFDKANYFYPYRKELEFHLGTVFGIRDSSESDDLMNFLLGFNFLLPKEASPKWEIGADLTTSGYGHAHIAKRVIHNEKGSFRPYYEYGVLHKFVPDEKFASLSNWENYLLLVSVGLGDIVQPPRSVQIELQAVVGLEDILVMFTYGYTWGF